MITMITRISIAVVSVQSICLAVFAGSLDDTFLGTKLDQSSGGKVDQHIIDVLSLIFDKADTDHNGKITAVELRDWIRHIQTKYVRDGIEMMWEDKKYSPDGTLSWDNYVAKKFGAWTLHEDTEMEVDSEESRKEKGYNYKLSLARDRRRWKKADRNNDDKLTKVEFKDFAFPEDAMHMRNIVVEENMENLDLDGDGKMSLEEFIADYDKVELTREYNEKPMWLEGDMEHFKKNLDRNGDGFVDKREMANYLTPDMIHHANLEVKHVFRAADKDNDHELSREEFLNKADLLVHTHVTKHGEVILKHDEF